MIAADIEAYSEKLQAPEARHYNIEPAEAAYLRQLVRDLNAKRVLEIGTSTGYSAIWIALALRETGGRLITIDPDKRRHDIALAHFQATGLGDLIDARLADALEEIPNVDGPLDLAFLDAVKSDYLKYYELALPKVRPGGILIAHNVKSHRAEMADFLERIQSDPAVETRIVTPGKQGFSVSKVRKK